MSSSVTLPSNIGFIGLGNMGLPMFSNLISKLPSTSTVHFYDVSSEAMIKGSNDSRAICHLDPCSNAREVAEKSDIVISIVPEGKHTRAVYLTPETGVLAASDLSGKILVDSSTIDTGTSLEVGEETKKRHPKAFFYDGPVSGGVSGAGAGTLTIMMGCPSTDPRLPLLTAVFLMMAGNVIACGAPSLGLVAKLCNNYLSLTISLANAEMYNVAMKSGMDPKLLQSILNISTGNSRNNMQQNPVPGLSPGTPASNGYKGGFKIEFVKKDMGLAIDAAERVGAQVYIGQRVRETYMQAEEDPKCAGLDSKVIYRWLGGDENWEKKLQ